MDSQTLKNEINRVVDKWVSEVLKSRFLQKPSGVPDRSLWDKFKQGLTNWWWGPKGDKWNPYVWRNRFGDELGVKESFDPSVFSLKEYMELREVVEGVESNLNEENQGFDNLRLMKLVRSAADELKVMLFKALDGRIESRPQEQPNPNISAPVTAKNNSAGDQAEDDTEVMSGTRTRRPMPSASDEEQERESGGNESSTSEPVAARPSALKPSASSSSSETPKETISTSAAAGRKTNRAKIEDAAEEISRMEGSDKSKIVPSKDWLNRDGTIKKEKLAHVLAWMAMKPHVDPLDGATIKDELRKSLGVDVELGVPRSSKGALRKYLEDTLFGSFEQVLKKLGIEASATNVEDGKKKETSEPDDKVSRKEDKKEEPVDEEDQYGLKRYFQDGQKERPIRESIDLIIGFLKHFSKDLSPDKKENLNKWWGEKRKELKDIFNPEDRRDSLVANIAGTESYIDQISTAVGLDASSVRSKMIDYIRSV